MTAREKAFELTSDPAWQAKFRLADAIAREMKAREAERERQRMAERLVRLQAVRGPYAAA